HRGCGDADFSVAVLLLVTLSAFAAQAVETATMPRMPFSLLGHKTPRADFAMCARSFPKWRQHGVYCSSHTLRSLKCKLSRSLVAGCRQVLGVHHLREGLSLHGLSLGF